MAVAAGLQKKDLRIQMELDSTEGLLSAVEAGLGVTFVSRWAVRSAVAGDAEDCTRSPLEALKTILDRVSCRTCAHRQYGSISQIPVV
jgi:DNA-binding transcriptional LysR family regulator